MLVDRGGTFTDVIRHGPDGALHVGKLLSQTEGGDATAHVADGLQVDELRLGTTVATNALLERRGERVLLVTTRGFGDLLAIGSQERLGIFDLCARKRRPLHAHVVEIDERILADGSVRRAPDVAALRDALDGAWDSVAVALINAHRNPRHEELVEQVARELGIPHVTLSHRASPEIGAVPRGDTTVADAYLTPVLRRSVDTLRIGDGRLLCMRSSGGLTTREQFSGKDALLSGPAGGVVATRAVGRLAGFPQVIGLDMGGTSTDVCRCGDELERVYETITDGVRIRAPSLNIITVAAGGGSICAVRDGRFTVGPESAGADPGPACYGRGGPATVTDCNLVLGRLRPEWFPHMTLDAEAAQQRVQALAPDVPREDTARGFLRVAVSNMADAIRSISVARGFDPRAHALCAFGGAGAQHACQLARALGMRHVIVHPLAGVLSAWGLGRARRSEHAVSPVFGSDTHPTFPVDEALAPFPPEERDALELRRSVDARYVGVEGGLTVPWSEGWRDAFERRHEELFGFRKADHPVELVAARVEALAPRSGVEEAAAEVVPHAALPADETGPMPVFRRDQLTPGAELTGPALIVEDCATTVVEADWRLRVDGHRQLILEDLSLAADTVDPRGLATGDDASDPVTLEVMSNRFMGLAEQMGEHLRRVAHSTNIKERLDYSCALFDHHGRLVANAPHIPVHLGAMGETVRGLLERQSMRPGDAWLSNDPYAGGSHLPDLTVVTPVFRDGELAFLVANRGHHADVGGRCPGSMPPDSTHIDEEGTLFQDVLLLRDGRLEEADIRARFAAAGTRDIDERLSDLSAQVACNTAGARLLGELCDELGTGFVQEWMARVERHAADVMREVVAGLDDGDFEDSLDDGSRLKVSVRIRDGRAVVDFAGTAPQQAGNRNAPRAVTVAAVLYVFRTLAQRPIPLNAGCLEPLDIRVPPGSLLDPLHPAAVVGGNVETSQRIVDILYGALDVLAASQGTMNNLTLGDEQFGYYETICGGAGAGLGFDGESAVHTHMTNTRITDPEILEARYPVVVKEFSIRRGSGGAGVWRGGDGVVRELEFLRPLDVSLLAERRTTAPFGLRAESGAPGVDQLSRDGVRLLTPGGGGFTPSARQWTRMTPAVARLVFREGRVASSPDALAVDWARARVVIVDAARADAACADLGDALLHRSAAGRARYHDEQGAADLSTDVLAFERSVGHAAPLPAWPVAEDDVILLVHPDAPITALPGLRGVSLPGVGFLLGEPAPTTP